MSTKGRMHRLLEVRRHEESVARQTYAVALRHEQDAERACDVERAALVAANDALREAQVGTLDVTTWRRLVGMTLDRERILEVRENERRRRAEARAAAEAVWREARQRERSIEKLEERRAAEAAREARRKEQKTLDEVGLRRFAAADSTAPEGGVR